jgi:hypothetical protein
MKKILFLSWASLFLLFSFTSTSTGEGVFKYIDKNGTIHFTDSYESIPEQYRNQIKLMKEPRPQTSTQPAGEREKGNGAALRKEAEEEIKRTVNHCRKLAHKNLGQSSGMDPDELMFQFLFAGHFCTEPEISSRLDVSERNRIRDIDKRYQEAKKSFPKDKLENMEGMTIYAKAKWKAEVEKGQIYEGKELALLDDHLRGIWRKMTEALRKKDVDQTVTFFAQETRESYRKQFTALRDHLPDVADEMKDIQIVQMRAARDVEYEILTIREGKKYSFQLIFIKDADDEWKILHY